MKFGSGARLPLHILTETPVISCVGVECSNLARMYGRINTVLLPPSALGVPLNLENYVNVTLTLEQVNEILGLLAEIPLKWAQAPVQLIHQIVQPQVQAQSQQQQLPEAPAEVE